MAKESFSYKKALAEIEDIVTRIEKEEADIDELSELVRRASNLIKKCKEKLKNTGDELDKILEE